VIVILPQEGVSLLEVRADSDQLVDEILDSSDTELAEVLFDDVVVMDGESLPIHLGESSLVDQVSHQLASRITDI
jgi:hypothetical protein